MSLKPDIQRYVDAVREGKKLSPRALGVLVDEFKMIEDERLKADKAAAALKVDETFVKTTIVAALKKSEVTVGGGQVYKVELTSEDQPTVKAEDWPKFYAYILKNKAFELLERRPGKAAIKERWNDGVNIPGVTRFPVDKLSVTKLKG